MTMEGPNMERIYIPNDEITKIQEMTNKPKGNASIIISAFENCN
jgi:hypothetical protein